LQSRSWEQDGQKRSKVEVVAQDVTFLGSGNGQGGDGGGYQGGGNDSNSSSKPTSKKKDDPVIEDIGDEPINLDDIPF
jgi:single-strand DNA-binding protein